MKTGEINNNSGIYTITNLINNKMYIGFCSNFRTRFFDHKYKLLSNTHKNEYLQFSYNKYGENNFIFEILEECGKEFLASQENYWCNLLNSGNRKRGYNIQPTNPDNKKIHSKETKIKISKSTKGVLKSEETKKKMSYSMTGKLKSEEHKKKLSISKIGTKMHPETKEKLRLSNTGRLQSNEEKEKRAESLKKPIIQYDMQMNFIREWESMKQASEELGIASSHIGSCCLGKRNKCGNYKWKYKYEKFFS